MKDFKEHYNAFYRAYSGTSFSPEKRAEQCVADFSAELIADLAELGDRAGNYAEKYVSHVLNWADKKSRCLSSMITGPAKFPTARNMKANNSEHAAWEEFRAWRDRYIKRAFREPVKSPEQEIDDALAKLDKAKERHAVMVGINKIVRKNISIEEKKKMIAEEYDFKENTIENIFTPDCFGGIGFARFTLTNSNARIKNLEDKLKIMSNRIVIRDKFDPISFNGGVIAIEDNRVVIKHTEKPSREIIAKLKSKGFHWSPKGNFWCRKYTSQALRDAKELTA